MTRIEWTDATWNPVTGCTKISAGCKNCYAERMAKRLAGRYGYDADEPFRVTVHGDKFEEPRAWKKPRRVFVCSMGDLFHDEVPNEIIADVSRIMRRYSQHTYQILTKRPERAASWALPPHVWLGTSAENQENLNRRIAALSLSKATVRFLSLEPLLGPIDLAKAGVAYNWVIVGCESGPGRRPCNRQWAHDIVRQCNGADIPVFVKQLPRDDGTIEKMPELFGRTWEEYPR